MAESRCETFLTGTQVGKGAGLPGQDQIQTRDLATLSVEPHPLPKPLNESVSDQYLSDKQSSLLLL